MADSERRAGRDRGPLHGVPISLKDLIDEAGIVTTAASHVLDDRIAPADAPVVTRLREAGAVIVGRTNLHEFAFGTTSEDSAFGPVRHPRDGAFSAGGSSGGAAAAVLTGMGLGAIGTDTGGSVRIPSACCGLVGLKPSAGDVPSEGVIPLSWSLDCVGPIARTVADARLLFHVLAGRPTSTPTTRPVAGLRVLGLGGYFAAPLQPEVATAFAAGMARLVSAGATIHAADIEETASIVSTYVNIVLPEAASWHATTMDERPERYTPPVLARAAGRPCHCRGRTTPPRSRRGTDSGVTSTPCWRPATSSRCRRCRSRRRGLAPRTSSLIRRSGVAMPVRLAMLKHTQLFNLTGHPAITIPLVTNGGWPVGLQLVGRIGQTDALLAIAEACEKIVS